MRRLQRAAILAALAEELRAKDSWCGETHLQKAMYFLQELLQVPTRFSFVLYKHGPFSFDLRDEITAMRADGLLEWRHQPGPYGPSLVVTEASQRLRSLFPRTLKQFERQLDFTAQILGEKGVAELERLATALHITLKGIGGKGVETRAERLVQLKPHVSLEAARAAVQTVDDIMNEAATLQRPPGES